MNIDSIYTDKYHNVPKMTITSNESDGRIKVDITFETKVSINGELKTSDSHTYDGFMTPAKAYQFS